MLRYSLFQKSRNCQTPFLRLAFAAVALFMLFATPLSTCASQVTLAWDPNGGSDLAGYKVYYGTSSGNYSFNYDAGNANTYTVSNLTAGTTYYFAATAYDVYGNESDFSTEVSYVVAVPNHPPVAQAGTLTTPQGTPGSGVLAATDPDGDSLTYAIAGQGSKGSAVITNVNSGAFTYTPNLNAQGADSFSFQAKDPGGLASTATVTVTITPVNHAPVAQAGTLTTLQGIPVSNTFTATDPDGDPLTYAIASQGSKGVAVITNVNSGAFTYTPNPNAQGADAFSFQAKDPGGLASTATVTVTITPVNHAPVAQAGTLTLAQDTTGSGTLVATDPDKDAITYAIVSQGSKGVAVITNANTGSYLYTPNRSAKGTDSFTFQAKDPAGLAGTATVSVTITAVNHAPVATNSALTIVQDSTTTGKLMATDVDGDVLKYQMVSTTTLGTVKLDSAKGSFTYTPKANATGTDTFTFKANDGTLDSNVASVKITISPHVKILLEAEQGTLTAPMTRANDYSASGGKYIYIPSGRGNVLDPLAAGGQALYSFSVPVAGNYVVWGRVLANSTNDNSFFVSMDYAYSLTWHTALGSKDTWVWDQVTDNNAATPQVFYLQTGTHTLAIKQREDGTKLDSILITTQPKWIPETVYSNAENGAIDGWDVFDADPAGALITNVYEDSRESYVTQLAGSGTNNGYRLRSKGLSNWANSSQLVMAWSMEYAEDFVIYVDVQTSSGARTLQYEPLSSDYLGSKSTVRLGLGTGAKDGQWHTFVRDLQADLNRAQSRVKILSVNSFSIRGSGKVDDIKLRQSL